VYEGALNGVPFIVIPRYSEQNGTVEFKEVSKWKLYVYYTCFSLWSNMQLADVITLSEMYFFINWLVL